MGENEKFCVKVCLEYKFAKGKGRKEGDCSWRGEVAQIADNTEWFQHLKNVNS